MRRRNTSPLSRAAQTGLFSLVSLVAASALATGCTESFSSEGDCGQAADCAPPSEPACETVACVGGRCQYAASPSGAPLAEERQVAGDCQTLVCDGLGKVTQVAAEDDCCTDASGCAAPSEPACESVACVGGTCSYASVPQGLALPEDRQMAGDCQIVVCDGLGSVTSLADDGDTPPALSCVVSGCAGGAPTAAEDAEGTPCIEAGVMGVCASVNASPSCVTCVPSSSEPCYTGPSGTENVGVCAPGARLCDAAGEWGPCQGDILPAAEMCGGSDESCDGVVDEGCTWGLAVGGDLSDAVTGLALDPQGGLLVTGSVNSLSVDLVGIHKPPLASPPAPQVFTSAGPDLLLAKYDKWGSFEWATLLGDGQDQRGLAIAVDSSGKAWATGRFAGSLKPGLASVGLRDVFVVGLDESTGVVAQTIGFGTLGDDEGRAVAISGTSVVVVGSTGGATGDTVDFGAGPLPVGGSGDIFLAAYDKSTGAHLYSKVFGDAGPQRSEDVAIDASGNVFLAASVVNGVNFGGGTGNPGTCPDARPGGLQQGGIGLYDMAIAKFDASFDYCWVRMFGEPAGALSGTQSPNAMVVDDAGDVYLAGEVAGMLVMDGFTLDAQDPDVSNTDVLVAKLSGADGTVLWAKSFGDDLDQLARAIAVRDGKVVVTGSYEGTIDFGAGPLPNAGDYDVFVAVLSAADGATIWAEGYGGTGKDDANAIALDATGYAFHAGAFPSTIDFGQGLFTAQNGQGVGASDGYIGAFLVP